LDFSRYLPFPDKELGGGADYDDPTCIPMGLAVVCRNMRFRKRSVRVRDGYQTTMSYPISAGEAGVTPFDMTGVEALDVLVNNPQQVVIAFDSRGDLLQEAPTGSGTLVPLTTPFALPTGASMQTAKAYNRIIMAFSDLTNALSPPLILDGPTGVVAPVSQTPIGAIWTPGTNYLVGDAVRTSQNPNRWFRCIVPGQAGNVEPTWPTLDGYLAPGNGLENIIGATAYFGIIGYDLESHRVIYGIYVVLTLPSAVGFVAGDPLTVSGVTPSGFDTTTATVTSVGTNTITYLPTAGTLSAGQTGTGGTASQTNTVSSTSARVTDPNGTSQWVEWTPTAQQFVPAPEAPELVLSIKGQGGAPSGSIATGLDVYICFAYQNANGESAWTQPIVYSGSAGNDVIEVFFQQQNENPGPGGAPAYNAAGYGGPRMPQWLMSVLGLADPVVSWPTLNCLNVYVNAVAHGSAAPATYYQYVSGGAAYSTVIVSNIPSSGTTYQPRTQSTAALTTLPFIGAGGPRYLAVERMDLNDSLVPIDPGSPLQFTFTASFAEAGTANVTFIQRSNNVVTCTVDQLAGFAQGSGVIISGVDDTSFDGSFVLTGVAPNQFGGATLIWAQSGDNGGSTGGTAQSASAASAFIVPRILIALISRTADVVTATVNSLQGIINGVSIQVAGVSDSSFNGQFTVISWNTTGGVFTITWDQSATNSSGTGGTISPTAAGVGTNAPQSILQIDSYPPGSILGIPGAAIAYFIGNGAPSTPPPGFEMGATVTVAGTSASDQDGTFTLLGASTASDNGVPGWCCWWKGPGTLEASFGGTLTLVSGASPVQGKGNVTAIARVGGTVTATLDTVAGFVAGTPINVIQVTDSTYDGSFILSAVNTSTTQLTWSQAGPNSSSSGGQVSETAAGSQQPTPVAILPPGGPFVSQDIAAWSVEGGSQAGPFTYIPEQDPTTPFSATIVSISNQNGAVTALLSSTSGLVPGDTVQVSGTPNGWFDGVFVLAQVAGNTVEWAGQGPATGYSGGTVSLVPTHPTDAMGQNNPVPLTTLSRLANGIVSAQVSDVSNLNPGQRIQVSGTADPSYAGQFVVLSVSQNQLPGSTTPLAGTATWQSATLLASSTTGGSITGLPGIILDAIDNDLANGDDVTPQLSTIPAPSCANVVFSESLNMMVYTIGQDSSHYFSNPGDPANIANPGGILGVAEANGQRTRGFVETISGELISLKEKSGYEITVGSSTPNEYGVSRRWFGHGPCGPRAWDAADDFIVYFDEDSGLYRYHQGVAMQVGQEKQGTWDRLTKTSSAQVCVAIDNVRKEIHVALPLDGSTVPNHDLVLNYFNGWEEPLMLTMTGELMPNPHGRRWSDNDGAANGGNFRLIKVIQRTLPSPPPSPIIVHRQVVFCLSGVAQTTGATGAIDMSVPEQMSDNGAAIAPQYQPAFAQSPTLECLVWDKMKARVLGLGNNSPVCIQPVTEDPNSDLAPVTIDLSDGLADSRELGLSEEVNELFSVMYTNEDPDTGVPIPGAGFELHRSVKYGKVRSSGTPEDQGSN
jgi:hypothetical protein